jgi:hypothetical protein
MSTVEKIGLAIVTTATITTLVLPGRQTPAIIEKFWGGFAGTLRAATGR